MRKGAEKLAKFLNAKQQGRLDTFFKTQEKKEDISSKGAITAKGAKRKNVSVVSIRTEPPFEVSSQAKDDEKASKKKKK